MTSLLTNVSAMSALSSLTATQKALANTQDQVSSGLRVAGAQDNAAYWSIGVGMKSQVGVLSAINDSLNLNSSLFDVTTASVDTVITAMNGIKDDIIAAKSPGVDRKAIQLDISAKQQIIDSARSNATFNGQNLLQSPTQPSGYTQEIQVENNGVFVSGRGTDEYLLNGKEYDDTYTYQDGQSSNGTYTSVTPVPGSTYSQPQILLSTDRSGLSKSLIAPESTSLGFIQAVHFAEAQNYQGVSRTIINTVDVTDPNTGVVTQQNQISLVGLTESINQNRANQYGINPSDVNSDGTPNSVKNFNGRWVADIEASISPKDANNLSLVQGHSFFVSNAAANKDGSLTLAGNMNLMSINLVSVRDYFTNKEVPIKLTDSSLDSILQMVEGNIQSAETVQTTVAAYSNLARSQKAFNSALSDAITAGVGALTDADMSVASTRLQALQTQQQLGIQSLSIANSNSSLIMKLFA